MQGVSVTTTSPTINICPIGDIQWDGDPNRVTGALQEYISDTLALPGQTYYIGMGDYVDFASPSNRTRLANANMYDTARQVISDAALHLVDQVYEILKPTKGRWLGLLTGHHYFEYLTGRSTDEDLAERLGAPHLGDSAYVQIRFQLGETHTKSLYLWAHHGSGNGQSKTYGLRKLETRIQPRFEADVYLMGHTTGRGCIPVNRIQPHFHNGAFRLRHRELWLVNTGGWAKAYEANSKHGVRAQGDYAERDMLPPATLGAPVVKVKAKVGVGGVEFKIKGIS